MDPTFTPQPNKEAAALIAGKPVVSGKVFRSMLPEIKARVFTITGIAGANVLQTVRDAVAAIPQGDQTWDEAKQDIVDQLDPYLGDGADARAETILRVNGFETFSAGIWRVAQANDDTTHLQYLHGECKVPTESHIALNGVILPKNDPFWDDHYGPWGHIGCVCYARPMDPDQVDDAKAEDEKLDDPSDANVIEGPALKQLNDGTLVRGGRRYDVSAPDDPDAFHWHPDDLKISMKDLRAKYDPEVFDAFEQKARDTKLESGTLWTYLDR